MDVIKTKKTLDSLEREKALGEIEGMYEIPTNGREEIVEFLARHDYLFPILKEAEEEIAAVFREGARLCLELHHDLEEGWDELFIVIKSEYNVEEALRLENRLAEEWFLDRMKDTKGRLNITGEPL